MKVKVSELKAIIKLINDPNPEIFEVVKNKLLDLGTVALLELKEKKKLIKNEFNLEKFNFIIDTIEFSSTLNLFKNWVNEGSDDLLNGVYLISKYNFPDLDIIALDQQIEKIKRDAWLQMNKNLTPLEQIKVLNHILFNIHKFVKNTNDFYSPDNSYLNKVIDTKKGNPISIAILYLIVGIKLGIPLYGVNLPKNFILAYVEKLSNYNLETDIEDKDVSFYINPYNNGVVLTKREIDIFLKDQKIKPLDSFYNPCDNSIIAQRLLLNLVYSYERLSKHEKVEELKQFLSVFKTKLPDVSY